MVVNKRPPVCPWSTYPSHSKNRELQVNADRPLVYGSCAQTLDCFHCAGTLMKPNLLLQLGRPFTFVPCPCCSPDAYRKKVARLKDKLPVGSGPGPDDLPRPPESDDDRHRRRK